MQDKTPPVDNDQNTNPEEIKSWSEWRIYLVKAVERIQSWVKDLNEKLNQHAIDIAKMKVTIYFWSIILAFVTTVVANVIAGIIIWMLVRK